MRQLADVLAFVPRRPGQVESTQLLPIAGVPNAAVSIQERLAAGAFEPAAGVNTIEPSRLVLPPASIAAL